jgi:hypothetical protein
MDSTFFGALTMDFAFSTDFVEITLNGMMNTLLSDCDVVLIKDANQLL